MEANEVNALEFEEDSFEAIILEKLITFEETLFETGINLKKVLKETVEIKKELFILKDICEKKN